MDTESIVVLQHIEQHFWRIWLHAPPPLPQLPPPWPPTPSSSSSFIHCWYPTIVWIGFLLLFCCCWFFKIILQNHYAPVSQTNWCNMTFTGGNLFPSHTCIGWPELSPQPGFELRSPVWQKDNLPTALSLLFIVFLGRRYEIQRRCFLWTSFGSQEQIFNRREW